MKVSIAIAIVAVVVAAVASLATVEAKPALERRDDDGKKFHSSHCIRMLIPRAGMRDCTTMIDALTTMACMCMMNEQGRRVCPYADDLAHYTNCMEHLTMHGYHVIRPQ
ncbi:hypothetical protein SYNPS1DRAFT_31748 [Syncephalis pseudoplumigaleata]|uniref:Uncharacterized protein n=1 Tax=Syncephalis pseudoplumigaleata TaxID=1712513 RepID=A0A4V1J0T1_9FUNG|nr:hypothetical protein SYNPS1DRAFT_31748 [Syncephalis pseudoplumigaleata]|eukprot:RKP22639.1 hypothetical protein SYNPS1DRAFT_31748 [Syncephalis pseudoplumigaleata]